MLIIEIILLGHLKQAQAPSELWRVGHSGVLQAYFDNVKILTTHNFNQVNKCLLQATTCIVINPSFLVLLCSKLWSIIKSKSSLIMLQKWTSVIVSRMYDQILSLEVGSFANLWVPFVYFWKKNNNRSSSSFPKEPICKNIIILVSVYYKFLFIISQLKLVEEILVKTFNSNPYL